MTKPKIQPLGKRVLVKRAEAKQSKGGIFLPDSAQEKPKEGIILKAGPGEANDEGKITPLSVKEGDKVLFSPYSGTEVNQNDEEYLILKEEEILGIIES